MVAIFIDREAGEKICLVASVCLFACLCVCPSYRVFISRSLQNYWAFKMVVVSTGCAIAVDHAFNFIVIPARNTQNNLQNFLPPCIEDITTVLAQIYLVRFRPILNAALRSPLKAGIHPIIALCMHRDIWCGLGSASQGYMDSVLDKSWEFSVTPILQQQKR